MSVVSGLGKAGLVVTGLLGGVAAEKGLVEHFQAQKGCELTQGVLHTPITTIADMGGLVDYNNDNCMTGFKPVQK